MKLHLKGILYNSLSYMKLFNKNIVIYITVRRRDALMYHIGSCKERNEHEEVKRMLLDLDEVDKV